MGLEQGVTKGVKAAVTEESILTLPDFSKAFEIHTDASDFAIGGGVSHSKAAS